MNVNITFTGSKNKAIRYFSTPKNPERHFSMDDRQENIWEPESLAKLKDVRFKTLSTSPPPLLNSFQITIWFRDTNAMFCKGENSENFSHESKLIPEFGFQISLKMPKLCESWKKKTLIWESQKFLHPVVLECSKWLDWKGISLHRVPPSCRCIRIYSGSNIIFRMFQVSFGSLVFPQKCRELG